MRRLRPRGCHPALTSTTFGTHTLRCWIEAGESVKVVSARLGHASAVETLETYAHLWPDSDEHTVSVLDAAWSRHRSQAVIGKPSDRITPGQGWWGGRADS
jgi:integrase